MTKLCYNGYREWLIRLEKIGLDELKKLVQADEAGWIAKYEEATASWEKEASEGEYLPASQTDTGQAINKVKQRSRHTRLRSQQNQRLGKMRMKLNPESPTGHRSRNLQNGLHGHRKCGKF